MSAQAQQQQSDLQALLNEETQKVKGLQMELAAKESEIEYLSQKMTLNGVETSSIHSGNELDLDDSLLGQYCVHQVLTSRGQSNLASVPIQCNEKIFPYSPTQLP